MQFEIKNYKGNKYIQYTTERGYTFSNAEYFMFDVTSDTFKDFMSRIGGFTANMTTRYIKEHNLDVSSIMLCSIPQEYNDFIFGFVYLDKDKNVLSVEYDNDYGDYKYFKEKFENYIIETGFIFDLKDIVSFHNITEKINKNPSTEFGIEIEGRPVTYEDVLIYPYSEVTFRDEKQKERLDKLDVSYMKMSFTDNLGFVSNVRLKCEFFDSENNQIKEYQVFSGIKDREEYIAYQRQEDEKYQESKDMSLEENYSFNQNLSFLKQVTDKCTYYQGYLENTNEKIER